MAKVPGDTRMYVRVCVSRKTVNVYVFMVEDCNRPEPGSFTCFYYEFCLGATVQLTKKKRGEEGRLQLVVA